MSHHTQDRTIESVVTAGAVRHANGYRDLLFSVAWMITHDALLLTLVISVSSRIPMSPPRP